MSALPQVSAVTIKQVYPAFADTSDAAIEFAIQEARHSVDATWGDDQQLGLLYMVAHILVVKQSIAQSGSGQQVLSESFAGMMSITYSAAAPPSFDDLTSTPYGVQFKALLDANFPAIGIC